MVLSDVTVQSSDAVVSSTASLPSVSTSQSQTPLGTIVRGNEWSFQYPVGNLTSNSSTVAVHTPSTRTRIQTLAAFFQEAEFLELEAFIIPREGSAQYFGTVYAGWAPSGTTVANLSAIPTLPAAAIVTIGGHTSAAQPRVVPCALNQGMLPMFRGNVTQNYNPVLHYGNDAAVLWQGTAPSSAPIIATIYVRGRLRCGGPAISVF